MNIIDAKKYRAEGFTEKEIPLIARHDTLYNQWKTEGYLKPRKEMEVYEIARRLKL